jgi:hypothetical protein
VQKERMVMLDRWRQMVALWSRRLLKLFLVNMLSRAANVACSRLHHDLVRTTVFSAITAAYGRLTMTTMKHYHRSFAPLQPNPMSHLKNLTGRTSSFLIYYPCFHCTYGIKARIAPFESLRVYIVSQLCRRQRPAY